MLKFRLFIQTYTSPNVIKIEKRKLQDRVGKWLQGGNKENKQSKYKKK